MLALQDTPNGLEEEGPVHEQSLEIIGQEMVPLVGTAEEEAQFKTPNRPRMESDLAVPGDLPRGPEGEPKALAPSPLFTEEQLSLFDEMYRRHSSPLLPRGLPPVAQRSLPDMVRREADGGDPGRRMAREMLNPPNPGELPTPQVFDIGSRPASGERRMSMAEDHMWKVQIGKELQNMGEMLRQANEENKALKEEIALVRLENKFYTPESERLKSKTHQPNTTTAAPRAEAGGSSTEGQTSQMDLLMVMMQNMQEIQKRMLARDDSVEVVRSGVIDLPKLSEWDSQEGPLKMGDWMALLEPAISDLSTSSELWWSEMVREVQRWYENHLQMAPLDRAAHDMSTPQTLQMKQWQRLERRVASMLLAAVPDQQREELVAAKRLNVFSIMCHLQLTYQPGGLGEKQTLLHNIESPPEATSLGDAVLGLRRWMRWRQRAEELKATEPDPSVLVRAITRLTARVLESHRELSFRIALARSTLMVDTRPTKDVVGQFSTHLLAEIEQVAHMEKKNGRTKAEVLPKVKKIEEEGKGGGKGYKGYKDNGKPEEKLVCKYFTQENGNGCRKGKSCKWAHVMDDKRRCFTCGSVKHMASKCPTVTTNEGEAAPPKVMKAEKEDAGKVDAVETESMTGSAASSKGDGSERVKSLIEEANQMLKTMQSRNDQENQRLTVEELQRQLNELRSRPGALRAFRLTRMSVPEEAQMALLDSGATHPLRCLEIGDEPTKMDQVMVSLADGTKIKMLMTKGGVMVSLDEAIEPIIPLGWLAQSGCTVDWTAGGLEVIHPVRGMLPVVVRNGCPQIPRVLALELIKDYEISEIEKVLKRLENEVDRRGDPDAERYWLEDLVKHHPVLQNLPEKVKKELAVTPGEWKDLPFNRFKRKEFRKGCVVHLYAGKDEGYTLEKALKARGYGKRIMEIDILRSEAHDMLGGSQVYRGLLRAVMDGSVRAVIGGPNCRTRSVLRHYPPGPRPLREWNGGEYGREDLNYEEQKQVDDDDVLLWRLMFLGVVGDFVRKSIDPSDEMIFAVEQPEEPHYKPEVVSLWWTPEWKSLKEELGWGETAFNQGDLVHQPETKPIKPTKFGGNLDLRISTEKNPLAVGRAMAGSGDSKSLSRWVPKLMDYVADALCRQAFGEKDEIKVKAMTWEEHCAAGHVPFRRDCRLCQEARAKSRPHRKVMHPLNGTLSVDVAGPLRRAPDVAGPLRGAEHAGADMRYILVAAFTWLKPKGGSSDPPDHLDPEREEVVEDLPEIEDEPKEEDEEIEVERERGPWEEDLEADIIPGDEEVEEKKPLDEVERDGDMPDGAEEREEPEMNVFRFAIPLAKKVGSVVLQAINELYIQLRVHGYTVVRLHSDRGGEFRGRALNQWCRTRDILRTKTAGMSPQSNGRAERSVQEIKARIQRALKGAELGPEYWPAACRFVHQLERRRLAMRQDRPTPPFGREVLIKRRYWGRGDLEDTHETARYMYQDYEGHGHCVLRSDGRFEVAPYFIAQVPKPVEDSSWIAIVEEIDKEREALAVRRRLREKTAVSIRKMTLEESVDGQIEDFEETVELQRREREDHAEALRNVLEEEGRVMLSDGLESMAITFEHLRKMKAAVAQTTEEEDVLRTRIVSVKELLDEREKWTSAIQTEMHQLFEEKGALVRIDEVEFKEMQKRFGNRLTVVPMKCVLTKKPGPKRRFRMVACGNYAEKTSDDTYAAGADAVSVRYALKKAAESSWSGVVIDVKTAFLNAPLYESELVEEAVVLKPPSLLLKLGFARQGEFYKAVKAIYGLRQSPKRWGDFRDQRMHDVVSKSGYYFRQAVAEPNMWRILRKTSETEEQDEALAELHGFILVYVDDMLILALLEVMMEVIETVQREWATSAPEFLSKGKVKYLGMELYETSQGFFASQEDYVEDRLKAKPERPKAQKVPTMKDMYPEAETSVDPTLVRQAQQTVGELLWLSTRTRPEIAFSVSRCSQEIIRAPRWVCELGEVVWGYLAMTKSEGIWFLRDRGENWEGVAPAGLQVFTDISYSPSGSGARSHGCVMVTWDCAPLWWKCSRQAFPTMSTAEAELMEAVEGFALGDAVHTLLAEHEGEHPKRLWVDNAAAVSVLSLGPCTWRTRHLRIRAHHVLWRLASTDWLVNYLPGRFQVADLGTKALPVQRVLELKELLNIGRLKSEGEPVKKVALAGLVMLGGSILKGVDSDDAAPQGSDSIAAMFLVIYTVAVIFLTLLISGFARKVFSGEGHRDRSRDRSSSSDEMPGIWGPEGAPGRRRAQAGRSHEADREGGGAGLHEGLRRRRGSTSDGDALRSVAEDPGEEHRDESLQSTPTVEYASPARPELEASPTVVFNVFSGGGRPEADGVSGARAGLPASSTVGREDPGGVRRSHAPVVVSHAKRPPPRLPWRLHPLLYVTKHGEKYHSESSCRSLANSNHVEGYDLCLGCIDYVRGNWQGRTLLLERNGGLHIMRLCHRRNGTDEDAWKEYSPCSICCANL